MAESSFVLDINHELNLWLELAKLSQTKEQRRFIKDQISHFKNFLWFEDKISLRQKKRFLKKVQFVLQICREKNEAKKKKIKRIMKQFDKLLWRSFKSNLSASERCKTEKKLSVLSEKLNALESPHDDKIRRRRIRYHIVG